jgi:hypothetical protein
LTRSYGKLNDDAENMKRKNSCARAHTWLSSFFSAAVNTELNATQPVVGHEEITGNKKNMHEQKTEAAYTTALLCLFLTLLLKASSLSDAEGVAASLG